MRSKAGTRFDWAHPDQQTASLREETLSCRTEWSGRVFSVETQRISLPDQSIHDREMVRHSGGSCILPLDDEGNCYLVSQFRIPYAEITVEAPAGKLDEGEDPRLCAIRELKEETGFTAKTVTDLGQIYPSPGYVDEVLSLYLARGLTRGEQSLDDGEFLQVIRVPFEEAVEAALSGELRDAKTVVALLKADALLRQRTEDND